MDAVLARTGNRVRLATPLGIGKPNHLLNAFYRRAKADPSIDLQIFTALTLSRPQPKGDLEQRFFGPFADRVWAGYPEIEYELDRLAGRLPPNVRVFEFYLNAGRYLGNAAAQRDYISTNYTFAARDIVERGINVVAHQICRGAQDGRPVLSLSCNPDVSLDLLRALRKEGRPCMLVGQINPNLPFMLGEAVLGEDAFELVVDDPAQYPPLFCTPKTEVSDAEFLIGLYASTLVRDGGELQIGIGSLGDALVYALKLRHEQNEVYLDVLERLGIRARFGAVIDRVGGTGPFKEGLFAATEMLVDGFMHLVQAGILRRKVYDDLPLQRLLAAGRITEQVSLQTLDALRQERAIDPVLDAGDFAYLTRWGILRPGLRFEGDRIVLPDGTAFLPDLRSEAARTALAERCLGTALTGGRTVHAGFFVGPKSFYDWLHGLPDAERALIDMRSVSRINQLYGHEELDRLHRRHARFINTGMMATLLGAVVSDGLESGQVVSGVGGQYNFVAMAHALPEGRSILQVRSTRTSHGQVSSGIVFKYGHATIPRHLRDIVITEHGIADLRGRTDEEVVQHMLAVTDGRFQDELLAEAQQQGKLGRDYQIPAEHRHNHAAGYKRVFDALRQRGLFPPFPFGTELTPEEIVLSRALRALQRKTESVRGTLEAAAAAVAARGGAAPELRPYLARMGLEHPHGVKETAYQRLLTAELRALLSPPDPEAPGDSGA